MQSSLIPKPTLLTTLLYYLNPNGTEAGEQSWTRTTYPYHFTCAPKIAVFQISLYMTSSWAGHLAMWGAEATGQLPLYCTWQHFVLTGSPACKIVKSETLSREYNLTCF